MSKLNLAIIGAGAAGLSAAWEATNDGHSVTVYEAGDRVGGLAAGFRDEKWDWTLEKFYHHWFTGDDAILTLADELGVRDKVIFKRPKTSYWKNGDIIRSEIEPISVLMLPMSPLGKLQFMLGGAFVKLTPFWQPLEHITAANWMQRWMGAEGYDEFFRPLLIGKFSHYYDKVNMAWMWSRVKARSLKLGTYEGGFQAFLETLAEKLRERGVTICTETPVQRISIQDGQPTLTVNGDAQRYDRIISTTSPQIMLKLAPDLESTPYGNKMDALESIGGLCVVYALEHGIMPDDTYWLNLPADSPEKDENEFPFLAMVEHTNFLDRAHYGGDHIVYCGDYAAPDHEYFQMSDEALMETFLPSLKKVNPAFKREWIRKWWVWRAPYAQPVPGVDHSENIPDMQTPLDGVLWASMSQIYPWDRGTNFSVALGRRAARFALGKEPNATPFPL